MGIHGAALTNIIFRRNKPLKFMELYPDCYLDPFYYWICIQYNFDYAAMLCKSLKDSAGKENGRVNYTVNPFVDIIVDTKELERRIDDFMR
jgi:hypothetical protein